MVLAEQVRSLVDESNRIDDATIYDRNSAAWGIIHSYGNITLTEDSLIAFKFNIVYLSVYRLKIGDYYVHGGLLPAGTTYSGIAFIAAGTHAVVMEHKNAGGSGAGRISNFQLGVAKFSDQVASTVVIYSSQISKTVLARTTCIGSLKNAVFAVNVWAYTPGGQTNFENVGDALTNGVQLSVDGVQVNWTIRLQDTGPDESASANFYGSLTVGSAHTFDIGKDNANTVVHISIIGCPWILAAVDNEPVTLNFAQAGTFYAMLEPLCGDPTKNSKLGKKRAVSFGDSTNYYSVATPATGIMTHSYTFEIIYVENQTWAVSGLFGCLSHIAVDLR